MVTRKRIQRHKHSELKYLSLKKRDTEMEIASEDSMVAPEIN